MVPLDRYLSSDLRVICPMNSPLAYLAEPEHWAELTASPRMAGVLSGDDSDVYLQLRAEEPPRFVPAFARGDQERLKHCLQFRERWTELRHQSPWAGDDSLLEGAVTGGRLIFHDLLRYRGIAVVTAPFTERHALLRQLAQELVTECQWPIDWALSPLITGAALRAHAIDGGIVRGGASERAQRFVFVKGLDTPYPPGRAPELEQAWWRLDPRPAWSPGGD